MTEAREHILISHLIDGEADEQEWREFELLADAQPQLWRDLVLSQRDQAGLARAMAQAATVADAVQVNAHGSGATIRHERSAKQTSAQQ